VRISRLIALTAFLVLVLPALAQDKPATLKWKLEKDKPFYQEMSTTTKQTMKVSGTDVVQEQQQTFIFGYTPKSVEGDNKTIEQKILGVKMSINIGGTKVDYDSTKDSTTANPLGDFFNKLVGSTFTLTLDKDNKVTKIEGREAFVNKLIGANPQMESLLKQILSDEALKEMAEPTFGVVPGKEVKKGDSWTRSAKLDMGPIGKYENTYKYTFEGAGADKLANIKVDTTVKYNPPGENAMNPAGAGALPFKIKTADLKSTAAGGSVKFDEAKGRVESSDMTLDLEGSLTIEIAGQSTKVDLKQNQKTTIKTLDKNPVEKPAEKPAEKK
jgi:hypothetical protein